MDYMLCEAAIQGDTRCLNEIMQRDPLILDKFLAGFFLCKNPLHVATSNCQTLFVKQLLRLKPELTQILDSQQRSALHLASAKGYYDIVEELMNVSPEMCLVRDRDGNNPLHVAAMRDQVNVLKLLVQINPEAAQDRVDRNETILHLCVKHDKLISLRLLLDEIQSQAFVNAKDNDGNTILHTAILKKRYQIVDHVLGSNIIKVNERNGNGDTAKDILSLVDHREANQTKVNKIKGLLRKANAVRARDILSGEEITNKKDSLMVVASLMATMAFQAGVSPPGGVWQDDSNGHRAGEAVMAYNYAHSYPYFLWFNTIGFIASLMAISLLGINGLKLEQKTARWILTTTMWLATTAMGITYAYSNVMVTPKKEWQSLSLGIVIAIIVLSSAMALLQLLYTVGLVAIAVRERKNTNKGHGRDEIIRPEIFGMKFMSDVTTESQEHEIIRPEIFGMKFMSEVTTESQEQMEYFTTEVIE